MNLKIKEKIPGEKKKHTPNAGIKESASIILNLPTEKLQAQRISSIHSFEHVGKIKHQSEKKEHFPTDFVSINSVLKPD